MLQRERRSDTRQVTDIRRMKEVAEEARVEDQEYHMTVLKKWAEMSGAVVKASEGGEEVTASAKQAM